jgi:flagellar assembly protein FliH
MSSRIIRGDDRVRKTNIRAVAFEVEGAGVHQDELSRIEKESFEKGYREGERVGRQKGDQVLETTVKRYDRTITELVDSHAQIVMSLEMRTVELALEIARKVIQREVSTDPDLVCALALVALRRVQAHQEITLRVSRHDFSRIHDSVASVNGSVAVVEDSSLERGDFMIDTGQTHLDGRLQSQVEALGRAMLAE